MPQAIPSGFHTVTPSIVLKNAAKAIEFYKRALGAEEFFPAATGPDGKVMHADLKIGDSHVFISDEVMGARSAETLGGSPVSFYLYVQNVDDSFKRATAAGCQVTMPVTDQFWGDRYGRLKDPFGFEWGLATHVEDLSPEEMERRQEQMFSRAAS
jgi:uncharacterized glyoxalase superfamily protein PhnB